MTKMNGQLTKKGRQQQLLAAFFGVAACLLSKAAFAQQASALDGIGSQSCSVVLEAKANDRNSYVAFAAWVNGFVSAANGYEPDTFDLTPWQTPEYTMAQIARSCESNPDAALVEAVGAYIRFLKPARLTEETPLVAVGNETIKTYVYLEVLAQLKSKLDAQGYDTGDNAPEAYGAAFQSAVTRYQQSNGLRTTGLPDLQTLSHIMR